MNKLRPIWIIVGLLVLVAIVLWAIPEEAAEDPVPAEEASARRAPVDPSDRSTLLAVIDNITDSAEGLDLTGRGEPGSSISTFDSVGRSVSVTSNATGVWETRMETDPAQISDISMATRIPDGSSVVSDQRILWVPTPSFGEQNDLTQDELNRLRQLSGNNLIVIAAPGNASKIISSPFNAPPSGGPLRLTAIDYDNGGWAIFTGMATQSGFIRVYINGEIIGETGTDDDGAWQIISPQALASGALIVRAEFIGEDNSLSQLRIPFERKIIDKPLERISVDRQDTQWTVSRPLIRGGLQNLTVFSEGAALPESQNPSGQTSGTQP